MSYYEQLYDVDFFSDSSYVTKVGTSSMRIEKASGPKWATWSGTRLSADEAVAIWSELGGPKWRDGIIESISVGSDWSADELLLVLLTCEEAYRQRESDRFFLLSRLLQSSGDVSVQLKAVKLQRAWHALSELSSQLGISARGKNNRIEIPLRSLIRQAAQYVARFSGQHEAAVEADVLVEVPVRRDWTKKGVSPEDQNQVEDFYRMTMSYILELTAANFQVETLFNYSVILEILQKAGVRRVFDYGAGIGTFLLLAEAYGISGTYADIASETMNFARNRIEGGSHSIDFVALDPRRPTVPEDVDCVICTEVLEHVFDPDCIVQAVHDALRPGGLFVVSESFDFVKEFCAHLPRHEGKGGQPFLELLQRKGFRQIQTGYDLHPTLHVRI